MAEDKLPLRLYEATLRRGRRRNWVLPEDMRPEWKPKVVLERRQVHVKLKRYVRGAVPSAPVPDA